MLCLLDHGADINSRHRQLRTPLSLVAMRGHLDIVLVLFDHHADVNCQDIGGWTPLYHASSDVHYNKRDQAQIVKLLLEHGANPNARYNDHKTPLHMVPSSKHEVARVPLRNGADVEAEDKEGRTQLVAASAEGRDEIAELVSEYLSK